VQYATIKRGLDVVFSLTGIVISTPLIAVCAVAVKAESKGPALFKQQRLGLNGKPFTMYKLRSMTVGAEAGGVYEVAGDTRVTRIGRVLRKTSLDELPQLYNILTGDMSFIGPRPTLTYHPWPLEEYSTEQRRRFRVRPGITGLAQVSGRKQVPWNERLVLDARYVDSMSFALDARILARTLFQVLRSTGNVNTEQTAGTANPVLGGGLG